MRIGASLGLAGDGGGGLVRLAREAGALEVLAVGVNVLAQAAALGGDFANGALLVAEADAVTEATGAQVAPYGALVLGGVPRPESHRLQADRRHHPRRHRRRSGNRCPVMRRRSQRP